MYAGRVVELGTVDQVFTDPQHPYTQGLLSSVISLDTTELRSIEGSPPDLVSPPPACRFAARCPAVFDDCHRIDPVLGEVGHGHTAACLLHRTAYPRETGGEA
jgi:oligopeptide/dipeptide ABC transporter ATP-binding protein